MEISVPKTTKELKSFLRDLDVIIWRKAMEWGRKCYKAIIEALDEAIVQSKPEGLKVEHRREVWHQTVMGEVKVVRRQYRDEKGHYRYPVEELLGMERYQHKTTRVKELVVKMASGMAYRSSAEVLRETTAVDLAHQTIWRTVGQIADRYLQEAQQEMERLEETGEIPLEGNRAVERLFVEADGVMVALQRARQQNIEVKVGIAYEGWEKVGKDRYRTVNRTAYAAVGNEEAFWHGMNWKLMKRYDLARVGEVIVGGDGASWIRGGAEYMGGRFQLDGYHLARALTVALGNERGKKSQIWRACQSGEVGEGLQILGEALQGARGEKAQRLARVYRYLRENSPGLGDYRLKLGEEGKQLRRPGAIEGNVDKLVAKRTKRQGMSWSLKGLQSILCIRLLAIENRLGEWLREGKRFTNEVKISRKKIRRVVNHLSLTEDGKWLQAYLPALRGPHVNHSWVQILKQMTQECSL